PVPGAAERRTSTVAEPGVIVQIQATRRKGSFRQRSDEMNRYEAAAKLNHFRTAGGSLEPRTVVEFGVPIADRRVITAERNLEMVALIVADNGALHFGVKAGCGGRPCAAIGSCRQAEFSEIGNARGKR